LCLTAFAGKASTVAMGIATLAFGREVGACVGLLAVRFEFTALSAPGDVTVGP
jgi:hypothetical protein